MKEEQKIEEKKFGKRTPLYQQRSMGIKEKPGFIRYQVVERPGEVERFLTAGWRPCTDKDADLRDKRVQNDSQLGVVLRQVVNRRPGAEANTAIWMEIEEEFYKEDQNQKRQRNDEKKAAWNPKNIQQSATDMQYYGGNLEIITK